MTVANSPRWEHFAHDADIGVAGIGPTKSEAFRQAAIALTGVVTDPAHVRATTEIAIACGGATDDLLLLEWLNAVIFEMAVRSMVFADFTVSIEGHRLTATARGEPVDIVRHEPAVEIKGATMTALAVTPAGGGWRAQCIVDV